MEVEQNKGIEDLNPGYRRLSFDRAELEISIMNR